MVISTGGNKTYAVLDQKDCAVLALCGAAGIIVDGMLFDPAEEEATGIPVFARGVRPVFLHAVACASVDVPISCGNVAVCPGDWIVADADGVLCIMRSKLEEE